LSDYLIGDILLSIMFLFAVIVLIIVYFSRRKALEGLSKDDLMILDNSMWDIDMQGVQCWYKFKKNIWIYDEDCGL